MHEVLDFMHRYLDAEYEAHELDIVAKSEDVVLEAFRDMDGEYFAKAGIQPLSNYLHGKYSNPEPEYRKERKAVLQRRPLHKITRYGKGKRELYRAFVGLDRNDFDEPGYWNTFFLRRGTKLEIVSAYRIASGFSLGVIKWDWQGGEKIAASKLGKPLEILRIQPPKEKTCLADFNADK